MALSTSIPMASTNDASDTLQRAVEDVQYHQRAEYRDEQVEPEDDTAAESHGEHEEYDHDEDGFDEVYQERIECRLYLFRLEEYFVYLHTGRHTFVFEPFQRPFDLASYFGDIRTAQRGDGDAQCPPAVVPQARCGQDFHTLR